jgi:hypothetical protein
VAESDLYKRIEVALLLAGLADVWRNQAGRVKSRGGGWMRLAPKGSPDLVGFALRGPRKGCFVGIEVKVGKERENASQADCHARIEASGGIARVVRSAQEAVDELTEALR